MELDNLHTILLYIVIIFCVALILTLTYYAGYSSYKYKVMDHADTNKWLYLYGRPYIVISVVDHHFLTVCQERCRRMDEERKAGVI